MASPIYFFTKADPYFELSNFAPYGFEDDGAYWPTVEHYFQAQKFTGPGSEAYRERIRLAHSPKDAKTLGQSRALPLRADWEQVKESIMLHALHKKFSHPKLREILLSTKQRPLIENSPYDRYWGIGKDGSGRNRLGVLLMQVRAELQLKT
jgi:ribA/ribD-fused uncharacterized protein